MAKINLGRIKLQFQGEYDTNQLYRRDDIVYHRNAMWILTSEYLPDGSSAYAPGSKVQGYNVKERTGGNWSQDSDYNGADAFKYTQYWTENERKAERQRTDRDGNPITHNSTYGSNEEGSMEMNHNQIDSHMGTIVRHQSHLMDEYDAMFRETEDDYSEMDTYNGYEQTYFRYHYRPADNTFDVAVAVSGGVPDFKIDNRLGSSTKGRQFAGYRNYEFVREGHRYNFIQQKNSNKYYPLGFSYTADGIHNTGDTGKSLGQDHDGPYYVKGTTSTGDSGFFSPLYKTATAANAEDTRRGGQGVSHKLTFNQDDVPGYETQSVALQGWLHDDGTQRKDTQVSVLTDASNNTYLQVTNAWEGTTSGGASTRTRKTIYINTGDSTEHHAQTGTTYSYVYIDGALQVGSNVTATVTYSRDDTTTANNGAGRKRLLINGKPVYQLVAETNTATVDGISGAYQAIDNTGTGTTTALGSSPTSNEGLVELYMPKLTDPTENAERTFQVSVASSKFTIDGEAPTANTVKLEEGKTYKFDQSDSLNDTHIIGFSTTADGTHGGGSAYTTGVTSYGTPGKAGAHTIIKVRAGTAKLYVYCTAHSGMGFATETYDTSANLGKTYAPANITKWRGFGKNGWVKYYLDGYQVDEHTYIETFFNGTGNNDDHEYRQKMENGKWKGGKQYNFENKGDRTVELYVPYQTTQSEAEKTVIYPFCLEPTTASRATTGMYNDLGFSIEKSWRGHKHWDKIQSSLRFRGEYSVNTQYNHNDVVSYKPFKRISTGEKFYRHGTGLYRCIRDNKGRPPQHGYMEPTRSPLMTKSSVTSNRLTGYSDHEFNNETGKNYPAHIQSYHNAWESFAGMNNQEQCAGVWFPNRGPIGWPYKDGRSESANIYRCHMYIDKNGAVWSIGHGSDNHNMEQGRSSSYFREVSFRWRDFYNSESRNEGGYNHRKGPKWSRYDRMRTPRAIQIEMGYDFTMILFDNGEIFHGGYGSHGQQGTGYDGAPGMAISPDGLENVHFIKINMKYQNEDSTHTPCALTDEGDVYTWGYNGYGECGDGRTQNNYGPKRIPREWFNDEKIIDICCSGGDSTSFYARTSQDNIYGWGRNNIGQLGDTTTTDKYRPILMTGFTASDNGGIAVWQACSHSSNSCFQILDGNGYIWSTGKNDYGNFFDNSTTDRSTMTQATASPAGDIVDFWACRWNGYKTSFVRLKNGETWTAGHSGGYYNSGDGGTGTNTAPVQVDKINNLKEVAICNTYSDHGRSYWLTDNGEFFCQGRDVYSSMPNPIAGDNWNGEDGTYKPYHAYVPAGTRIRTMCIQGVDQSTNYYGLQPWVGTEDGQALLWGYSSNNNLGHHATATWSSTGRAMMWQAGNGR